MLILSLEMLLSEKENDSFAGLADFPSGFVPYLHQTFSGTGIKLKYSGTLEIELAHPH
jgi:hypothetical protein